MEQDFSTLEILAEVTIGFVAFSAIVATLRYSLGKKLNPFQNLLAHYFIETGMMGVSVALMPLILWGFWQDEGLVATYSLLYNFIAVAVYLLVYLNQRRKINAPNTWASLFVRAGWVVWLVVVVITLSPFLWPPSFAIIAAGVLWNLASSAIIFASFLGTFLEAGTDEERARQRRE